jgi:hypothetical protein
MDSEASTGFHNMLLSIALRKISHLFEHSVGRLTRRDASSRRHRDDVLLTPTSPHPQEHLKYYKA